MKTFKKYDDAHWHLDDVLAAGLDKDRAATHIGMFLAWAIERGLASKMHYDRRSPLVRRLQNKKVAPGHFFLKRCSSKLRAEDFNELGNAFVINYYEDREDGYYVDYRDVFSKAKTFYHVPDSWASYRRLKRLLDIQLSDWQSNTE